MNSIYEVRILIVDDNKDLLHLLLRAVVWCRLQAYSDRSELCCGKKIVCS